MPSYRKRSIRNVSGLWTDPRDQMPEPGTEVMAIIAHCGYGEDSAQNVLLVHKQADDATWFTADDESELSYEWDVIGWLPMHEPKEQALAVTPGSVIDHISSLKENTRVLETRLRRSQLANRSLKGRYQQLTKGMMPEDADEVTKLKAVIAGLTEEVFDKTDELARVSSQRDRADKRTHEAYALLREAREKLGGGKDNALAD